MTRGQFESIKILAERFEADPSEDNFNELFLTIKIYFREEESLYQDTNHPDLILHKTLHKELERVSYYFYQTYFKEQSYDDVKEFCLYLKNWTSLHFECYDKSMLPYMNIDKYIQENPHAKKRRHNIR